MRLPLPESYALLGEIIRASSVCSEAKSAGDRADWWKRSDERFGKRLDYSLWREHAASDFAPSWGHRAENRDWRAIADRLATPSSMEFWGTILLLPRLLFAAKKTAEQSVLASAAFQLLQKRPILDGQPISCELARLLAGEAAHEALLFGRPSIAEMRETVQRITTAFAVMRPGWHPRVHPDAQAIDEESGLLPFCSKVALGWLYQLLRRVVDTGTDLLRKQYDLGSEADMLAAEIADLGMTAWRTCRMYRLLVLESSTAASLAAPGWTAPPFSEEEEYHSLLKAGLAYMNAGNVLAGATFAHLAFRTARSASKSVCTQTRRWGKWVHQCGLEMDDRFKWDTVFDPVRASKGNARPEKYYSGGWERFLWKLQNDQQTDPHWKQVLDTVEEWRMIAEDISKRWRTPDPRNAYPDALLKCLAHHVAEINNPETRAALLHLCLRYDLVSLAAKILDRLPPEDRASTLAFAHAVRRVQRALPMGFDAAQHKKFRDAIRDRFAAQTNGEEWPEDDVLIFHEMLMGRSLVNLRRTAPAAVPVLAAKFHDFVPKDEIRNLLVNSHGLWKRGADTVSIKEFEQFGKSYQQAVGGIVLFTSIVPLDADRLSVLMNTGSDWKHIVFSFPAYEAQVAVVQQTLFAAVAMETVAVAWTESFESLAVALANIAASSGMTQPTSLLLACSPELAGLPWQDFARTFWPGDGFPLVSLVPSFTWAQLAWQRTSRAPRRLWFEVSTAHNFHGGEFDELRTAVHGMLGNNGRFWNALAIIAGHGCLDENRLPSVELGTENFLQGEKWFEFGQCHVLVLHACMTGQVSPGILGDLGGLPGLVLGMDCRLVCAPISEVPVTTALTLQRFLCERTLPPSFSARYAAALEADSRVALYSLYGFATERVEQVR